ncbi:hypothetical protein CGLO_16829 [Colletotrichum gloeosporioides Cg-14]|uniref:C2H2-type domain-containing protein n=1 Tax=Colletotrichum gloeosporioides (strain Cg-14) TaxID=1237896 RepID=T0JV17_COLGC|nr:hypothetical protein CGLO_16829 [Colletotrichum gloeosporioides Cg-14]
MKGKEFLEIACPFFKKDPSKYSECLKRHRLKKIEEVKEHLWQQHRIPFYCPICKRDFPTARGRDRHIVDRICAIQEVFPFEGVSDDQRRQLFRNRKGLGLNKQWFQLWKLLLPGKAAPSSPFIKPKDGLEVVMFREFWSFHGESLIAKSVKQADLKSWDRRAEERDLASLYTEVLRNVIDRIVNKLDITWKTSKLPPSGSG